MKKIVKIQKDYDVLVSNRNNMPTPGIEYRLNEIDVQDDSAVEDQWVYIYYNIEDDSWFGFEVVYDAWFVLDDEDLSRYISYCKFSKERM